jgi:N-acetylglucosamine kinase-like BadF-type ATPase
MQFVLGIDQGNTHTRAAACDLQGRLLGVGRADGACHCHSGVDVAMGAIRSAAEQAMQAAGLEHSGIVFLHSGMTGADWPEQYALCQGYLRGLGWTARVTVSNDCIIAMRAGTARPYGAIFVAGSGANCAVRSPAGEQYVYSYFLDETRQGAGALGKAALVSVINTHSGICPPTTLTGRLLAHFGMESVDALCRASADGRLGKLRVLAPYVFEEAYLRRDPIAAEILHTFAYRCADAVTAGLRRFAMLDLDVEVVVSGSVFKGLGCLLIESFSAGVHRFAPRARIVEARYEPLVGAALLALEGYGVQLTEQVQANIEASAQALGQVRHAESAKGTVLTSITDRAML